MGVIKMKVTYVISSSRGDIRLVGGGEEKVENQDFVHVGILSSFLLFFGIPPAGNRWSRESASFSSDWIARPSKKGELRLGQPGGQWHGHSGEIVVMIGESVGLPRNF
jgi:hypothetical protein